MVHRGGAGHNLAGAVGGVSSCEPADRPFLNSLMAWPIERDSSGSFLAPKKKTPSARASKMSCDPSTFVSPETGGRRASAVLVIGLVARDLRLRRGRVSDSAGGRGSIVREVNRPRRARRDSLSRNEVDERQAAHQDGGGPTARRLQGGRRHDCVVEVGAVVNTRDPRRIRRARLGERRQGREGGDER